MSRLDPMSFAGDPQEIVLEGIFTPEDTPQQRAALARLETALALVEGWVCHVVDRAAGDHLALQVAHRLLDLDRHAPVRQRGDGPWLDGRVDDGPLPRPVLADLGTAVKASALPGVRPVDVGRDRVEHGVDVARVEGGVQRPQAILMVHDTAR
jgi:hypothetical protein